MYNHFFGFRERPFKLVPDPGYLFLSKSHEEALAHLRYAVSQGEGFVELLGEAGTGKTTLCRAFLDKLDDHTEAAYIFNPKLNALQLLKAINDEFEIDSGADNIKDLIDTLNAFLLQKKGEGKKVIVLIDEAQNLSREVLEQLRLLSNLETSTDKLLQIILAGQPELGDLLDCHELRQVRQRITLSCCLKPLNLQETRAYIAHRISIASQKPGLNFSSSAIRAIHRYSGGIPRLINIAADRSLLLAFSLNRHKIGRRQAGDAIRELSNRGGRARFDGYREYRLAFMFLLLMAAVFIFFFYRYELIESDSLATVPGVKVNKPLPGPAALKPPAPRPSGKAADMPAVTPPAAAPQQPAPEAKPPTAEPNASVRVAAETVSAAKTPPSLEAALSDLTAYPSREWALKTALKSWGVDAALPQYLKSLKSDPDFFRLAAAQNGFSSLFVQNDIELLKKLDMPAIVECRLPGDAASRYVVLLSLDGGMLTIGAGESDVSVTAGVDELKSLWTGAAHVLWKNFLGLETSRPFRLSKESVMTLKIALQGIGFADIEIDAVYDRQTREAIREVQHRHGLETDGIVGPLTQIALYNEIKASEVPRLLKK